MIHDQQSYLPGDWQCLKLTNTNIVQVIKKVITQYNIPNNINTVECKICAVLLALGNSETCFTTGVHGILNSLLVTVFPVNEGYKLGTIRGRAGHMSNPATGFAEYKWLHTGQKLRRMLPSWYASPNAFYDYLYVMDTQNQERKYEGQCRWYIEQVIPKTLLTEKCSYIIGTLDFLTKQQPDLFRPSPASTIARRSRVAANNKIAISIPFTVNVCDALTKALLVEKTFNSLYRPIKGIWSIENALYVLLAHGCSNKGIQTSFI